MVYMISIPKEIRKKKRKQGQGSEAQGKISPFRVGQPCEQTQLCN